MDLGRPEHLPGWAFDSGKTLDLKPSIEKLMALPVTSAQRSLSLGLSDGVMPASQAWSPATCA